MNQTIVGTMRETTTQASRIIRKEIKALHPDCKFKVTTDNKVYYSLITISLLAAPFNAYKSTKGVIDGYAVVKQNLISSDDRLTDETKKVLDSVAEIINEYQLLDRYFRLEVGSYDEPFINTTEIKSSSPKANRPITMLFCDRKSRAGGYFGRDGITDKKLEEHYDFPSY